MQWYQDDITRLKQTAVEQAEAPKVVFYGSSTFTYWPKLVQAFPQVQAVNMAFGGSTLAACAWFFKQVVPPQQPDAIMLYAGDNDLGDGRNPEEVVLFYEHLRAAILAELGPIPVCFVSIKLSPTRLHLRPKIEFVNQCISQRIAALGPPHYFLNLYPLMLDAQGNPQVDLFSGDGLHLSPAGYVLWQREIEAQIDRMLPKKA
jgi:lysophospholipase L1-like esterase